MKKTLFGIALLLAATVLQAQTLTFTAETVTGDGSVVPKLTWSTSPAAASCTASDGWTGTKAASGTETLAAITSTRTYVLNCSWPGDVQAKLTWTNATQNTDGSAYSNPKAIRVRWGTTETTLNQVRDVLPPPTPTPVETIITGLNPNTTYFFQAFSVNTNDAESPGSPVVSKTTKAAVNTSRTVGITVRPVPNPPTNFKVE